MNNTMLAKNEQELKIIEQHLRDFQTHCGRLNNIRDDDYEISARFLWSALTLAKVDAQIEYMAGRDLSAGAENFPW